MPDSPAPDAGLRRDSLRVDLTDESAHQPGLGAQPDGSRDRVARDGGPR